MVNGKGADKEMIPVEVAYALPHKQMIISLEVVRGTNMLEAVLQSGIAEKFPEIDTANLNLGIFGKAERNPSERILEQGDRVEIYRPLIADPKEVRKKRAEQVKARREAGED